MMAAVAPREEVMAQMMRRGSEVGEGEGGDEGARTAQESHHTPDESARAVAAAGEDSDTFLMLAHNGRISSVS